jgi:hypothetical protein
MHIDAVFCYQRLLVVESAPAGARGRADDACVRDTLRSCRRWLQSTRSIHSASIKRSGMLYPGRQVQMKGRGTHRTSMQVCHTATEPPLYLQLSPLVLSASKRSLLSSQPLCCLHGVVCKDEVSASPAGKQQQQQQQRVDGVSAFVTEWKSSLTCRSIHGVVCEDEVSTSPAGRQQQQQQQQQQQRR